MRDWAAKISTIHDHSHDDIGSVDKLPSLSSSSSTNKDESMVYLRYPLMSPTIISDSKLLPNDSFNQSFPPLPSQSKLNSNKKTVNYWYTRNLNTNHLPYIRPPSIFIEQSVSHDSSSTDDISHITSCISPRNHTKKRSECHAQIPDFDEENQNIINICIINIC
eukprot:UN04729